jgi:hypothetical protein
VTPIYTGFKEGFDQFEFISNLLFGSLAKFFMCHDIDN